MKRPTEQEREQLRANVERVRHQPAAAAAPAGPVEGAGLEHDLAAVDIHHSIRERVLELDVAATLRGGEAADDLRRNIGALGFARGWRW